MKKLDITKAAKTLSKKLDKLYTKYKYTKPKFMIMNIVDAHSQKKH